MPHDYGAKRSHVMLDTVHLPVTRGVKKLNERSVITKIMSLKGIDVGVVSVFFSVYVIEFSLCPIVVII